MSILNMTNVDLNLLSYLRCIDGEVSELADGKAGQVASSFVKQSKRSVCPLLVA